MKNRNFLLLLVFILLGGLAWYFANSGEKNTYSKGNDFAIPNAKDQVHKIFLANKTGESILVEKKNGAWLVNGKYPARPSVLNTLMNTMEQIRVREQVPVNAEKNVINEIASKGVKAEFYDSRGKKLKVIYVGGGAPGKLGTYAMLEDAKYPYVVDLGSWEGVIRPRFLLQEIDWRDKTVFDYPTEDIQSVKVEYYQTPKASFFLEKGKDEYQMKAIRPDLAHLVPDKPLIQDKVLFYLKGFEKQIAEAFENDNPKRDSIVNLIPFATIELKTNKGKTQKVDLFPVPGRQIGVLSDGTPRRGAVERYFASINDNQDLLLVQHLNYQRLFAPLEFFYQENEAEN